jgi:hypothetical protein
VRAILHSGHDDQCNAEAANEEPILKPLHNIEELSSLAQAFGAVAVVIGTCVVRCVRNHHADAVTWSVDGREHSQTYVAGLLSKDWRDITTDVDHG